MTDIVSDLADVIKKQDKPDLSIAKQHNIKLGLRNDDGSSVIAGMTTKGTVIGYRKTDDGIEPLEGKLLYCGIDVGGIADVNKDDFGFEETVYLLLTNELPTENKMADFTNYMQSRRKLPFGFKLQLQGLTTHHMMNSLQLAVQSLYGLDDDPDSTDFIDVTRHSIDIISRFPALVAYTYQAMVDKYQGGDMEIFHANGDPHAPHFLSMYSGPNSFTEEEAKLLDTFLILHAEHGGGNNSTFTVRAVTSSETDTFSAINAGLASLKGHLHGGANEKVMAMMDDIKENVGDWNDSDEVSAYLHKILRKEAGDCSGKIYGIGHAVYTLSDPRAVILKNMAGRIAEDQGRSDEYGLLCMVGELSPKVFKEFKGDKKVISPNVDFYSGFVLDCLGIPRELYTPLFAMSRVAGWCAHRLEQLAQNRIMRPGYFNMAVERPYVLIGDRI